MYARGLNSPAEEGDFVGSAGFLNDSSSLQGREDAEEVFAAFESKDGFGFGPGEGRGEPGGAIAVGLGEERGAEDAGVAEGFGFVGGVDAFDVDRGSFAG